MDTGSEPPPETIANPAAVADADQHARQEISGLRDRVAGRAAGYVRPLAAAAGIALSGWLIRRWRHRR